jgi:HD-GYP domain-containing protein (c-di-GMP phosphodiesterase class II)
MPVIEEASIAHAADPLSGYIAVHVEMLRRLETASVDLFVQYEISGPPVLYHRAGCELEPSHLAGLLDTDVQRIFVRTEDFQSFGAHLLESVESFNANEEVPKEERFAALQLALAGEIERTAHMIDCGPYVALSEKVGRELTSLLAASDVLPRDLFRLARHDFNTFTHVTNVAGYSVLLAQRLGLCPGNELERVAMGAMLHDIGKRFIPAAILIKPARLDPEERAVIETHPKRGYEELCDRSDITLEQLLMTYQHHERVDGTGYPVGITGNEIHPWAKMLAVVDVFDAMTGTRPYRRPATVAEAMNYIQQNAGTHFDPEVVECWTSTMSVN